jgi:glycopeptide antibiotics resistance protein
VLKKYYLPFAISWTLVITYLSLADVGGLSNSIKIPYKDKMVHFVFYFLFYFLWDQFLQNKKSQNHKFKLLAFTIGYGILMEILQFIMHLHRSADVYDVIANSSGAILALVLIYKTNYFTK